MWMLRLCHTHILSKYRAGQLRMLVSMPYTCRPFTCSRERTEGRRERKTTASEGQRTQASLSITSILFLGFYHSSCLRIL